MQFPYRIEKRYNFRRHLDNRDEFLARHWGPKKIKHFDNGMSFSHDDRLFSSNEKASNHYVVENFFLWEKWHNAGQNVVVFPENLIEISGNAEFSSIHYSDLHLPHVNFFLDLRPLNMTLSVDNSSPIEGVYIHTEHDDEYDFVLHFDFVGDFQDEYLKYVDRIYENFSGRNSAKFWSYSLLFIEHENITTVEKALLDSFALYQATYIPDVVSEVNDDHLDLLNFHKQFVRRTAIPLVAFMISSSKSHIF